MANIKLVIKIPQKVYEDIKNGADIEIHYGEHIIVKDEWASERIRNGTPLDDIKAEIQRRADDPWNMAVGSASQGLEDAIEILDNIGETESEE